MAEGKLENRFKWKEVLIKIVLISILLEVFVCNFRFWESHFWKDTVTFDMLSEGTYELSEGQYLEDGELVIPFDEEGKTDILVYEGDIKAENVFIKCSYLNTQNYDHTYVDVRFVASDEGNELEYLMNEKGRKVSLMEPRSSYIRLHPAGDLHSLRLEFPAPLNEYMTGVRISELKFNVPAPFTFRVPRAALFVLIGILFMLLKPSSFLYTESFSFSQDFPYKKLLSGLALIGTICFSLVFTNIDPLYNDPGHITQYHKLAEALSKGHLYMDIDIPDVVKDMDNPYDTAYRQSLLKAADEPETDIWDYAYYNGRLYVYFGVVPVLFTLLPFYVLTGSHMPISAAVSIFGLFLLVGIWMLLKEIFKRWFSKVPYILFLLSYLLMIFGSGIFYGFRRAEFYSLPMISAAAFAVWGLYFWFRADTSGERIDVKNLSLGSLLIALTAGCRPQFLLTAACAFPLFWKYAMEPREVICGDGSAKKKLDAGRLLRILLALALPAVIVAVFVMYYNYARFGSVFDFGANYNLTTNDMTKRGWQWDRTVLGLFIYLLQPSRIQGVFPFLFDTLEDAGFTNYLGITIVEDNYGGLVFNHIILILPFLPFVIRKYCDKQKAGLSFALTAAALVIVVADTQMAGILSRYMMDFGWMLCLAAIIIFMSIESRSNDNTLKLFLRTGLLISLCSGIILEVLVFFSAEGASGVMERIPRLYNYALNLVEFWG